MNRFFVGLLFLMLASWLVPHHQIPALVSAMEAGFLIGTWLEAWWRHAGEQGARLRAEEHRRTHDL